jgi:probable F420-dependent oxidoreductase
MTTGYKVRIGVAAGAGVSDDPVAFVDLVDALDDLGFDSIWVPDVITTPTLDPIAALAVAAGRRRRLKLGTHLIVPGRNPVLLAKQLATLDQLSNGRLLINAVLGVRQPAELDAQGVEAASRASMLEESLHIMRSLWSGETLQFAGAHHTYESVRLAIEPRQNPLEIWLGGQVPAALRRCGRIGEGWMPGLCTPAEAAEGREIIEETAAGVGRAIDREHFGMNISWVDGSISSAVRDAVAARRRDLLADDVIAVGTQGLAERIAAYLEVGFSKFVIRPAERPESWPAAVESVAGILALQT